MPNKPSATRQPGPQHGLHISNVNGYDGGPTLANSPPGRSARPRHPTFGYGYTVTPDGHGPTSGPRPPMEVLMRMHIDMHALMHQHSTTTPLLARQSRPNWF